MGERARCPEGDAILLDGPRQGSMASMMSGLLATAFAVDRFQRGAVKISAEREGPGDCRRAARRRGRSILTTLLIAAHALGGSTLAQPRPDEIERSVTRLMEAAEIPGLSLAVVRGGEVIWTGAYGVRAAGSEEPLTRQTVFEAASLSKPVFAYAVLRLAERGVIDLDEPLWSLLQYERLEHDERASSITPRMVLTHTAGLPNWGGTPLEVRYDPGERWSYSGEGFVYLQRALEEKMGLTLDEIARREVFAPLGMSSSSYVWRPGYEDRAATGHDLIGEPVDKRKPTTGNAAASLHTTAGDYGRFVAAVLRGEGLTAATLEDMLADHAEVRDWQSGDVVPRLFWGLGWGLQHGERGKALWHWGDNGTFRCFVIAYPEEEAGLVYFTNSENGLAIAGDLLSELFPDSNHAVNWLDYWRHDDPRRLVRIELRRASLSSSEEGARAYRRLRAAHPDVVDAAELGNLASYLVQRDHARSAVAVMHAFVEDQPESARAWTLLGEAQSGARRYDSALSSYRRAMTLGADDEENLRARIAWLMEGLEAARKPIELSADEFRAYAGEYGPRHVKLRDGALYYSREGATEETRLIPLARDLFGLESSAVFRIRFVPDDSGGYGKIVGLYADGRTDETPRSSR